MSTPQARSNSNTNKYENGYDTGMLAALFSTKQPAILITAHIQFNMIFNLGLKIARKPCREREREIG